jgi:hypothetical protein
MSPTDPASTETALPQILRMAAVVVVAVALVATSEVTTSPAAAETARPDPAAVARASRESSASHLDRAETEAQASLACGS